ncbi:MAG TPA: GtrA family protein [Mycobacteriales bacterium]|nr:GtrA family protein [Mycobacteriales bacterium]
MTTALSGLRARFEPLVREVAKFGVVGATGAVSDILLFNVFDNAWGKPLTAKALSTLIATVITYVGNRIWSFRHRARTGLRSELPRYFVISLLGLAIVEACLAFTVYVLKLDGTIAKNVSANVVGLVLGTLFRFWAYKRWVFLHPDAVAGLSHDDKVEDELESVIQI